jgi:hypothetical protein
VAIFLDALRGTATDAQMVQLRKAAELTVAAEILPARASAKYFWTLSRSL